MIPRFLVSFWMRARPALWPLSLLYGAGVRLRFSLYRYGLLSRTHPGVPSIAIGNLSLGGEGKTPLTLTLAEFFQALGFSPVVILRGYGGRVRAPLVVSEGKGPLVSPDTCGEEAYLYGLRLRGVPVVVGRDRVRAAEMARRRFSPDLLLFDDAFQHLRVRADFYFLVVSALKDPFRERLFPAGELREPVEALKRAQAVFITRVNLAPERARALARRFRDYGLPVHLVPFEPGPLVHLGPSGFQPYLGPRPRRVVAFCGLGDPENFRKTLLERGFQLLHLAVFPDHHRYRAGEIQKLAERAHRLGAEALITTEKDLVKIPPFSGPVPLLALSLLVRFSRQTLTWLSGLLPGSPS